MSHSLTSILPLLQADLADINFVEAETSYWSPAEKTVYFQPNGDQRALWTLLHESGHAALGHTSYDSDFGLLLLEVAAWEEAKVLGQRLGVAVDEDHVQDCLETYRDWLHRRSTCPRCGIRCFQHDARRYHCHNCQASWQVSASRFCRAYRISKQKTPSAAQLQQTEFA